MEGLTREVILRRIPQPLAPEGEAWFPSFLDALLRSGLGSLSIRAYRHNVGLFARWFREKNGTSLELARLSPVDLLSYRQHLIQVRRLKPSTINQRLQALRWFCRWAHRARILEVDPSTELKSLRVARRRQPAALTAPEVHALLGAAGSSRRGQGRRNYAIAQLLLQTGLRVGEVASLRIGDVQIQARSGRVYVRFGKGEKAREVPLNASARRALQLYLDSRPDAQGDEPLFLSHRGQALSARSLQAMIHTLAQRAKLARIRVSPHALRHTFALIYLKQNPGKLVELADLLGHDSLDTTAIYTQPSVDDLAEDLEKSPLNLYP